MISQTRRAARALTFAALSSSLALAYPLQAREHPAPPPAAPATVSETSQAPASGARVVAIPVPLPLPGQLKPLPQAEPPAARRLGDAAQSARLLCPNCGRTGNLPGRNAGFPGNSRAQDRQSMAQII